MESDKYIRISNARVNNLKNVSLEIPRERLVVITGLSGSGKSSLAFDTLYAEGQRRYVESLSSYARQFLGRMRKPECDFIAGLPPTIAIEQKVTSRNPRSTVGTSTEIYDYLRVLFSKIGRTYSPVSGAQVKKHTAEDLLDCMRGLDAGTRFTILSPIAADDGGLMENQLETYLREGFTRLDRDGEFVRIEDVLSDRSLLDAVSSDPSSFLLLIDRLSASSSDDVVHRLLDSAETAFSEGKGCCMMRIYENGGSRTVSFSQRFEADGIRFEEPSEMLFSFNSPVGACPECEGYGRIVGIDESLVIPNRSLSVYDGAVVCWRGEKMGEWLKYFILAAEKHDFPIFTPYYQLTQTEKDYLWHGCGESFVVDGEEWPECCIDNFFRMLEHNQYKIQYRVMLARYRGKTTCPACRGNRLRKEAGYVRVGGRTITELAGMPVSELKDFFDRLQLDDIEKLAAERVLKEITQRLHLLMDVGLEYLTMNRLSNTLSGGESQRINLVKSIGNGLVGSLYVLDEPSIGLHSRDTERLIAVLRQLQRIGNTVIVVEHDEEIIRSADMIIDVGPDSGRNGGNIVAAGSVSEICAAGKGYTAKYLNGTETVPVPSYRRRWNNSLLIRGARHNNLKGIDVKFPLNVLTVVTGVSGSGKSTLVRDILYAGLKRLYDEVCENVGEFVSLEGDVSMVSGVEFVDQNPIGKSTRSNPVTYVKAYDEIRKLFAEQQTARQTGLKSSHFSFNSDGGRCDECKGEGVVTVPMQFMSDLVLECESCHGKRFKKDVLDVTYRDRNIWDVLEMTVNQAVEFFSEVNGPAERRIIKHLKPLQQVGLGYVKLGQPSSTLSGGESQRVKLAYYLSLEKTGHTVFIFDEPTTGLHIHDIRKLLDAFDELILKGHTIIVIEHNLDVIKCADHIIDLGPEGGERGGLVVAEGTPEQVAGCPDSYTGHYLASKLEASGKFCS